MAEFNLIPERYILWRKFVSDLRTYLIILGFLVVSGVAGLEFLRRDIKLQANNIAEMRKSKAYLDNQHAEIRDLLDNKDLLETRFRLVNGLKGRIKASDLFLAMDRSLSDDIKFESWSFQRIGQPAQQASVDQSSSYFIIVDEVADNGSGVDGLSIKAEINLIGRAASHSAMAEFMRKLSSQKIVERVELVSSGSNRGRVEGGVKFEFQVELISGAKAS